MHIPASMLNGAVCPVTLAVGGFGVVLAGYLAKTSENKPSPARFAAVTGLVFALQMLNFPVQNGTSGHLIGGVLAAALLGAPFAVLSMAIVLTVQAVFFGDGGINALGANIFNMGLIGAGLFALVTRHTRGLNINQNILLPMTAWGSVIVAAAACSAEVALSGAVSFGKVLPAMLSVHALIGLGEAALTVTVVYLLKKCQRTRSADDNMLAYSAGVLALLAVCLSPFASRFPDGLKWVAERLSFLQFHSSSFSGIFPDYQAVFAADSVFATLVAGLIGGVIVSAAAFALGKTLRSARTAVV